MSTRGALFAAIVSLALLGSCVGGTDDANLSPSTSPTLNPNQLEALRRTASPFPSPSSSPLSLAGPSGSPSLAASGAPSAIPMPSGYVSFDKALEALLPTNLRGIPLAVYSVPASTFGGGGDMCVLLCPDEPARLQQASGVPAESIAVAISVADSKAGIATAAIGLRFPGVATSKLVDIRLKAGGHSRPNDGLPPSTKTLMVGRKSVVWATWPPFYQDYQGEFLYAYQDILFIVYGGPPNADGTLAPDAALMFSVLP